MASVVDSFNEALSEDLSYLKIILYSVPAYFCAKFFLIGQMDLFYFYVPLALVFYFGLMTNGVNCVRMNRKEILTLNLVRLVTSILKTCCVLIPQCLLFGFIGYLITGVISVPSEVPHLALIINIIIWSLLGSFVLTAYLSFAKYLDISQGFNFKAIFESSIDVFLSLLFFIPQLLIADVLLVGPVAYLFSFFQLPFTHWGFVSYCSMVFVVNVSMASNYLAQIAYEHIKGTNKEYKDNSQIDLVKDKSEDYEI